MASSGAIIKEVSLSKTYLGVDIETVSRIQRLYDTYGNQFLRYMIYSDDLKDGVLLECYKKELACIFSMKESISKLLGTGVSGMSWQDICLKKGTKSSLDISLHSGALERFARIRSEKIHTSFSYFGDEVMTIAISDQIADI